jgi:hypothetical protein
MGENYFPMISHLHPAFPAAEPIGVPDFPGPGEVKGRKTKGNNPVSRGQYNLFTGMMDVAGQIQIIKDLKMKGGIITSLFHVPGIHPDHAVGGTQKQIPPVIPAQGTGIKN